MSLENLYHAFSQNGFSNSWRGYHWVYRNDGISADFANETNEFGNGWKWGNSWKCFDLMINHGVSTLAPNISKKKQNKSSTLLSQQGFP